MYAALWWHYKGSNINVTMQIINGISPSGLYRHKSRPRVDTQNAPGGRFPVDALANTAILGKNGCASTARSAWKAVFLSTRRTDSMSGANPSLVNSWLSCNYEITAYFFLLFFIAFLADSSRSRSSFSASLFAFCAFSFISIPLIT